MEVIPPPNPTDFHFNSALPVNNFSTPTSPARISDLYQEFDQLLTLNNTHQTNSPATVPFAWEEKPGVPKSTTTSFAGDFEFDVSGEFPPASSVSAADLFHAGMIKPSEIVDILEIEPPSAAVQNKNQERGRERNHSGLPSSRSRRTRSLPPVRGLEPPSANTTTTSFSNSATLSASGSGKGSKKWSFKDLFLFRSASDGRALDRDPLKKYSGAVFRKHDEDLRNLSFRVGSGSGSRGRGRVSAHELHYTVNRAVSNDMKKKTFLPYKQGILGRLAFNPTVHALSNGFGFSNHGRFR